MTAARGNDPRVARIVDYFEHLQPADLDRLAELYSPEARFKDPFNEVRGLPAIRRVFEHMFVALESPRFAVGDIVVDDDRCFLEWEFAFRFKRWAAGGEQLIRGCSSLRLDAAGRIAVHRDYWDAAEEFYEKLPAIGALMRWLKRRANA